MNNTLMMLLKIDDDLMPEALALADLIQAASGSDGLIDIDSVSRGADMLHSRLMQISQIVKDSIKEVQQNDGKTDL